MFRKSIAFTMVKFKKIVYFVISLCFISFLSLVFVGCEKDEIKSVSKGLNCYNITANLSSDMVLTCSEEVEFNNNTGESLDNICFHLYPRAFRQDALIKPYTSLTMASCFPNGISYGDVDIKSVKVDNLDANWEFDGEDEDILKINLENSLENKKKILIDIEFITIIPNCTHRFGYYNGNINLGNWYPILCVFSDGEFDKTPYYATGDPFFSEMANYNINITYPSNYLLISTGVAETIKNEDSYTSNIKADAVRDFALNISDKTAIVSANVNNITVNYVGYKEDENLQDYLKLCSSALEYFNKSFGKYPYSTLSVVKTPFIYGGMEYPNIVFISDAIDDEDEYKKVIVHEIAHQWWYGVVGNNEVTEAWLDESLTEYSTALFFENNTEFGINYEELIDNAISSYTLYVDVIKSIRDNVNTKMNLSVNEYQNDYEYSYMIYVKGVIMFDELKNVVGENRILDGLKKYYSDNKYKIATKQDFYNAFKIACHKDLEGYFEGYLEGQTIITGLS